MSRNILIIEDEFLIAAGVEDAIHDFGDRCVGIASDAESALSLASSDVDIALVDVNLADGRTGPGLGEKLATLFGITVIFLTANPEQVSGGVRGALAAVPKPVSPQMLREILDWASAKKAGRSYAPPSRVLAFA